MKKLFIGAAFALSALAATTAHAQTTPEPAPAATQTVQDAQTNYNQQRDERKAADQTVTDNRRQLKEQQNQLKQQREQAKQQKEQLKMARQQSKAAKQQQKAAREQVKAQKMSEKAARKANG